VLQQSTKQELNLRPPDIRALYEVTHVYATGKIRIVKAATLEPDSPQGTLDQSQKVRRSTFETTALEMPAAQRRTYGRVK
jgi:hypothetical protein